MLKIMGDKIHRLTDQRRSHSVTAFGQLKAGLKVNQIFDEEICEFISNYFKKGPRKNWLEESCLISFRLFGPKREVLLFSSSEKRSKIDLSTFPQSCRGQLDQQWKSFCKKREASAIADMSSFQSPTKTACRRESMTPLEKQTISNGIYMEPINGINHRENMTELKDSISQQIPNLKSFGYETSSLIETSLQKMINLAIKKRELYIINAGRNITTRTNKITAMKHSLKDAKHQKDKLVLVIRDLQEDLVQDHVIDREEDHPLMKYVIRTEEDLDEFDSISFSDVQLRNLKIKLFTVRDLLVLIEDKYEKKSILLNEALTNIAKSKQDIRGIDSIITQYEEYLKTWRLEYSIPSLITKIKKVHYNQKTHNTTLLKWFNEFKKNNFGGFILDKRTFK